MYKRQIYQIAESNLIKKIDSVARLESNRNFLPELECSNSYVSIKVYEIQHDCIMLCYVDCPPPDPTWQSSTVFVAERCEWDSCCQCVQVSNFPSATAVISSRIQFTPPTPTPREKKVLSSLVGRCESGIIERFTDARLCVLFLSIWIYITNCRILVFIIFLPGCV